MAEQIPIAFPAGVAASDPIQLRSPKGKGYEINDVGVGGFTGTADLEVSVSKNGVWTAIVSPIANGQGAIADQYNWVRVNVTVNTGSAPDIVVTG